MLSILNAILSLGGLWRNGKTASGAIMLLFAFVNAKYPEYVPLLMQLAQAVGIPLTVAGAVHKVVKAETAAKEKDWARDLNG